MKISVLGSGSWGCALAQILVRNGHDVVVWGIDETEVNDINQNHQNSRYFKDVKLDERLKATTDMSLIAGSEALLLAVPSMAIDSVMENAEKYCTEPFYVINVAKGFHPVTHERMSEVIKKAVSKDKLKDVVSLIGPSHAEEVVIGLMTCVNAVCENDASAKVIQETFSNDAFRVYRNTDVIGAEIGVALKNVMAIASGILTGLGQGDNGDAIKINAMFMKQYVDGPLEFIYTTPEEDEEEIFEDHFEVVKSMNPAHVIVVPGRKSIDKAREYYEIIKKEYPDAEFYPLSYDEMDTRIERLSEMARNSNYDYVIMTGCGEEQAMWERIKRNLIDD